MYLAALGLHDFDKTCWKSTNPTYLDNLRLDGIDSNCWKNSNPSTPPRHQVEGGQGPTLADIEYDDVKGQFTQLLINKGHLDREVWSGQCPYYYLEVKSSPSSDRSQAFFMGDTQYQSASVQPPSMFMLADYS